MYNFGWEYDNIFPGKANLIYLVNELMGWFGSKHI
jgi:hypothetical protein